MPIYDPNAVLETTTQRFQFLTVGPYEITHRALRDLIVYLVDGRVFTENEGNHYLAALENHFYRGILPGLTRFPVPPVGEFYFLPALRVLWENYVAPPAQVVELRREWAEEELGDTDSLTLSDDSDLLGEPLDPDSVIDEMLLAHYEFDMWLDYDSNASFGGTNGQDDGNLPQ